MRDVVKIKNKNTGTYPIAFHLNGDVDLNAHGYDIYNEIKPYIKKCDASDADKITLCFAKWGRASGRKCIMEETLNTMELPWFNIADEYTSGGLKGRRQLIKKPKMLRDSLSKIKTEYIMGWDITDTFFTTTPNKIVERFESEFECDMLFNAELVCYPQEARELYETWNNYDEIVNKSPFRFLNSGLWIAKTDFCREIIDDVIKTKKLVHMGSWPGDQGVFQQVYKKYYPRIQVDSECKIFQATCNIQDECLQVIK